MDISSSFALDMSHNETLIKNIIHMNKMRFVTQTNPSK